MRELWDLWSYVVATLDGFADVLRLLGIIFGGR